MGGSGGEDEPRALPEASLDRDFRLVALVVVLAVPALRTDGREWWVWVPVAGALLGALGHVYLVRGRGNAQFA